MGCQLLDFGTISALQVRLCGENFYLVTEKGWSKLIYVGTVGVLTAAAKIVYFLVVRTGVPVVN